MMEGMPASDSTPKRMTARKVRFFRIFGEIYGGADPEGCGKGDGEKAQEQRADYGRKDAAEPAHVLGIGEDEFRGDIGEPLDEYDEDDGDEDGDREKGLKGEAAAHQLVDEPGVDPHLATLLFTQKLATKLRLMMIMSRTTPVEKRALRWSPVA